VSRSALRLDGYEGSHLGPGWYAAEQGYRWTQQQARALLHRGRGQDTLEVTLWSGPEALGPVGVTVKAAGVQIERRLSPRPWQQLRLSLPPMQAEQAILPVTISVDRTRSAAQLGAGDARDLGVAVRSLNLKGRSQAQRLPLSSVCNPQHWNDRFWRKCLDSMAFQTSFGIIAPEVQHRKIWEWVQGVAALTRLGCLKPSAQALGVAAGHEPPIYWLANRVAQVYATDLYSGVFVQHEASPDVLHDPDKYAPYPYPRERVHFMPMSGTDICFGNQTIDFVFSFCSIEHFGSRANSRRSLQEMARVLRPGGVAVVSTEVLLNDIAPQPEIFSPWELYEELVAPSGLLLIGDIAPANLAPYCTDPIDIFDPAMLAAPRPHFVLRAEEALFTSVMMVLQKV
jgi:SAM-dependent methyltransferase